MWTDAAREQYKDDGRRYFSDLTDAEWQTVEPVLCSYATLTVDLREMVNACLYPEKAGCPWRFLPKDFGPWQTVRTWHDRFRGDGIWSDIAALLVRAVRQKQSRAPEPSTAILDSQSVTSGPQAGVRGMDGNKKVRGVKRHVLTCSLRFVLAVLVTAANAHDTQPVGVLTDNGRYFTPAFARACAELGAEYRHTKPRTPQINGMAERFNGRIGSEVLRITIYSHQDLEQRVLDGKTPNQVTAERLKARRKLTRGKPEGRAGPDDVACVQLIAEAAKEVSQPDTP